MALIALGGGCSQATVRSFIAEQYKDREPRLEYRPLSQNQSIRCLRKRMEHTKISNWLPIATPEEKVMVCPELTTKFIYTVLFGVGNVGAMLVFPIVYIERYYGFLHAYGLGLGCIAFAFLMTIGGSKHFVKPPLADGVMIPAGKVLACAARNGFRMKPTDPTYQLACCGKTVTWSSQSVNKITRALGACRVLLAFFVFYICFDQMQNNLISQASDMNTGKTPNDLLPGMNQIACIVIAPLVEYIINPALSKRRVYLRPVTRMAIGFFFVSLSMLYAAMVERYIYKSPPCFEHPTICGDIQSVAQYRPNVWVQAPIYVLMATGEVFAMTTAMEYAEMHAPKDMKVLVQSINMLITGIGSAFALLIAEAARDPYLVAFYSGLAGGMLLTTIVFYIVFRNNDKDRIASPNPTDNDSERGNVSITGMSSTEDVARESRSSDLGGIVAVSEEKRIDPLPQPILGGAAPDEGLTSRAVL
ncbi:oligopeptide transporter [Stemphylium lycopersici]|nr:oligopeptide transporter [Stemphylium lycopersici]